jgi:hypothetical protein
MEMEEFLEEMSFTDRVQDIWSHRRARGFFLEIVEYNRVYEILRPKCPVCGKTWKERKFYFDPEGECDRKIQAWISSIMARHFRKEHGFNMRKVYEGSGYLKICNIYECPVCGKQIQGLMHALAHFVSHQEIMGDEG